MRGWRLNTVDVVIPTLKHNHAFTCFENLKHLPFPVKLFIVTGGKTWAQAVNIGIRETVNDVLVMDDDVFINENTFSTISDHYDQADIFGFKLMYPNSNKIQHAGGVYRDGYITHFGHGEEDGGQHDTLKQVCHVTTSLAYIKRRVFDAIGPMAEDIPGIQFEDVDFMFRAVKAGFKIMYLPTPAIHIETASKRFFPRLSDGMQEAWKTVKDRHLTPDFIERLKAISNEC